MATKIIDKLYNQPNLLQNRTHLSKVISSKLNNLDKLMKNPCSIFLATKDNDSSNTFLEDDVYFYLNLNENQKISIIEESSPKHNRNNRQKKKVYDNFEELDDLQIDQGPMVLNLKVPESIQPKLFRQIN